RRSGDGGPPDAAGDRARRLAAVPVRAQSSSGGGDPQGDVGSGDAATAPTPGADVVLLGRRYDCETVCGARSLADVGMVAVPGSPSRIATDSASTAWLRRHEPRRVVRGTGLREFEAQRLGFSSERRGASDDRGPTLCRNPRAGRNRSASSGISAGDGTAVNDMSGTAESEIRAAVKSYILAEFLPGEDASELGDETPLISGKVLDSIAALKLVGYLEARFGIEVEAHEADFD